MTTATTGPPIVETPPPERIIPEGVEPGRRIVGVDIARGLAILGMFTVHVDILAANGETVGGTTGAVISAPSGRAAVLFFLLSGVALSVIAARGSLSAAPAVLRRRGFALLFVGLVLTGWGLWAGSILEHYGVMFLLAPWLLILGNRALTALGIGGLVLGPIALLVLRPFTDDVQALSDGVVGGAVTIAWSLGVDGLYPLLVWVGFFAIGMRIGRMDLTVRRIGIALLAVGAALAILVPVSVNALEEAGVVEPDSPSLATSDFDDLTPAEVEALFDESDADDFAGDFDDEPNRDLDQLADTTAHSDQIAWAVQAAAIAMAILGAALLLPQLAQRLLWPLAAVGSISLSAYLMHLVLVTDVWSWIVDDRGPWTPREQIAILVGLEVLLVLAAMAIVWRWRSGPAERLLRWLSRATIPAARRPG